MDKPKLTSGGGSFKASKSSFGRKASSRRFTVVQQGAPGPPDPVSGESRGGSLRPDDVALSLSASRKQSASGKLERAPSGPVSNLGILQLASASMVGLDPTKAKKKNQDAFLGSACFTDSDTGLFMVCDGHGGYGELCSEFVVNALPRALHTRIRGKTGNALDSAVKSCFLDVNAQLDVQRHIDATLSGSTCCAVLLTPKEIITANVGDSRCIAAYKVALPNGSTQFQARALTRDHKPDLPEEKARIIAKGGRVAPWEASELDHIFRIWLRDEDTPGIAMSRSFGDQVAASVGVIAEPEIQHFLRTPDLAFLLVASDGVWEFMDDQEVVNFIISEMHHGRRSFHEAVDSVVAESNERWLHNEGVVDDITVFGLVFDSVL